MRVKKLVKLATQTQRANYYNNIASAWFIAGVITPFFTAEPITMNLILRGILSLGLSRLYLDRSIKSGVLI